MNSVQRRHRLERWIQTAVSRRQIQRRVSIEAGSTEIEYLIASVVVAEDPAQAGDGVLGELVS
jgi:hypothetical protein